MSKLLCATLLTLAIGCKDKTADAPKPTPTTTQPSDPSPAARRAEAPKLEDQPTAGSGSGSGSGSGTPVAIESKDPAKLERHKGGVTRGAFPVKESFEALHKKKEAAAAAKR